MTLDDLKKLNPNEIGAWPWPLRAAVLVILFAVVLGAGYMFMIKEKLEERDRIAAEEVTLRNTFETRQRRAAALDQYRAQLDEMQRTFGAMLRQLPGQTEVENLLVDISQSALAAGLEQQLFQPQAEVTRDFYAELPIRMTLSGDYHAFGTFASNVAALPRIVTLHDIKITPRAAGRGAQQEGGGPLTMEIVARTYRYVDETAAPAQQPAANQRGRQ